MVMGDHKEFGDIQGHVYGTLLRSVFINLCFDIFIRSIYILSIIKLATESIMKQQQKLATASDYKPLDSGKHYDLKES